MGTYSGKCDLQDHISMEKMRPSPDNPNVLVSDEMECFEIFKKKTGGVIYQHIPLELSEHNIDFEIERVGNEQILSKKTEEQTVRDRRTKTGTKVVKKHTYYYYGKEYTSLAELNKQGYYSKYAIHFETLLDIIPYYPYIISIAACDQDSETIFISKESHIDSEAKEHLKYGYESKLTDYYRKRLQDHYIEVVNKYFKEGANRDGEGI